MISPYASHPANRPHALLLRVGLVMGMSLALFGMVGAGTARAAAPGLTALANDGVPVQIRAAHLLGTHAAASALTVELVLTPTNEVAVVNLIAALSDPRSPLYGHWLPTGAFEARFGPTSVQQARIAAYMAAVGLHPVAGATSVFLPRFGGSTVAVEAAFHTRINDYRLPNGRIGYANATAPLIPTALAAQVQGVIGLDNLLSEHPLYQRPQGHTKAYGNAPGGTGLSPAQIRSLYNANPIYPHTNGNGYAMALFELSNWQLKDVLPYEQAFHLYNTPIHSLMLDGGPGTDHSGATEVMLDIDMQLALAPGIKNLYVYDAPNSDIGLVDEYALIAHQNLVAAVSTSWGACEPDTTPSVRRAETTAFQMMAAEGMSIFAAAGDMGAFACEYLNGGNPTPSYANMNEVLDPASNPYVTAVGGTSFFGTYDAGTSNALTYPPGKEYVWNTINNCTNQPDPNTSTYCPYGAGGGGVSRVWALPSYQSGTGVNSPLGQAGRWCAQAATVRCREVPDVAINADPNTGYGVFCTDAGDANCTAPSTTTGWLQVGGTSAGAPLWAAIATLAAGYHGHRLGLLNPLLYSLLRSNSYGGVFHDMVLPGTFTVSGTPYVVLTNGAYPQTIGYDMATGLGTPNIANLVMGL